MENELDTSSLTEEVLSSDSNINDSQPNIFGKSRYGRTHKPKLSNDYYNFDSMFDNTKESKKSPRVSQHVKLSSTTTKSPKINTSFTTKSPKINTSFTTKSPKINTSFTTKSPKINTSLVGDFVHITADSELEDMLHTSPSESEPSLQPASVIHDIDELQVSAHEVVQSNDAQFYTQEPNTSANSLNNNLLKDDGNFNVPEALKPVSDSDGELADPKSGFKPIKTYANRKKCFVRSGVLESFGLPDKSILSAGKEASSSNELKRYKNLDVVPSTSDNDINLIGKSLLNTPWKIASINTDMNTSEKLLDPTYGDASDARYEDVLDGNSEDELENNQNRVPEQNITNDTQDGISNNVDLDIAHSGVDTSNLGNIEDVPIKLPSSTSKIDKEHLGKAQKVFSKTKDKRRHKSGRKHHRHHSIPSTTLDPQNKKATPHKSSKRKSHHESKPTKVNDSQVIEYKETSETQKLLNKEKSSDSLTPSVKENKDEQERKLDLPVLHVDEQISVEHSASKTLRVTEPIKKLETLQTSPKQKKALSKVGETTFHKKKKVLSSSLKMFEEPLFSIPDATIRKISKPVVSDKTKTNLQNETKEKPNLQDSTKENKVKQDENLDQKQQKGEKTNNTVQKVKSNNKHSEPIVSKTKTSLKDVVKPNVKYNSRIENKKSEKQLESAIKETGLTVKSNSVGEENYIDKQTETVTVLESVSNINKNNSLGIKDIDVVENSVKEIKPRNKGNIVKTKPEKTSSSAKALIEKKSKKSRRDKINIDAKPFKEIIKPSDISEIQFNNKKEPDVIDVKTHDSLADTEKFNPHNDANNIEIDVPEEQHILSDIVVDLLHQVVNADTNDIEVSQENVNQSPSKVLDNNAISNNTKKDKTKSVLSDDKHLYDQKERVNKAPSTLIESSKETISKPFSTEIPIAPPSVKKSPSKKKYPLREVKIVLHQQNFSKRVTNASSPLKSSKSLISINPEISETTTRSKSLGNLETAGTTSTSLGLPQRLSRRTPKSLPKNTQDAKKVKVTRSSRIIPQETVEITEKKGKSKAVSKLFEESPKQTRRQTSLNNDGRHTVKNLQESPLPLSVEVLNTNQQETEVKVKRKRGRPPKNIENAVINKNIDKVVDTKMNLRSSSDNNILNKSLRTTSHRRRAVSFCCSRSDQVSDDRKITLKPNTESHETLTLLKKNKDLKDVDVAVVGGTPQSSGRRQSQKESQEQRAFSLDGKRNTAVSKNDSFLKGKEMVSIDPHLKIAPTNVQIGDIMWTRVGGYPYWPCIIMKEPGSDIFHKMQVVKKKSNMWYHVRFYGDNGRRSWVCSMQIMRFETENDLREICNWVNSRPGAKQYVAPYTVKPYLKLQWHAAVLEASIMKSKTVKQRIDFFMDLLHPHAVTKKKNLPLISTDEDKQPKITKVDERHEDTTLKTVKVNIRAMRSKSLPPRCSKTFKPEVRKLRKNSAENIDIWDAKKKHSLPLPRFAQIKADSPELLPIIRVPSPVIKEPTIDSPLEKKEIDKFSSEVNSECSLSDSDTFSKSSSSTSAAATPTDFQDLAIRQKRNNLFKGVLKHRVCTICTKPRDVVRCQGPCNGLFHSKCAKPDEIETNTKLLNKNVSACKSIVNKEKISDEVSSTVFNESSGRLESEMVVKAKSVSLSIAEQIDLKMKEVMSFHDNYADSTTDYTSSEETTPNNVSDVENSKKKVHKSKQSSTNEKDKNIDITTNNTNVTRTISFSCVTAPAVGTDPQNNRINPSGSEANNCVNLPQDEFKCKHCFISEAPPCLVCGKEVSTKNVNLRLKCSVNKCGRFYHPHCLKEWPQTQWSLTSTIKHKESNVDLETFVCPAHVCHMCSSDNPRAPLSRCRNDRVVKCLRCPATYHSTNYCVPAGTHILSTSQIICPRHLDSSSKKNRFYKGHRTINTTWCFICSKGGALVCCETCPTSVHIECLHVDFMEDGTFICEDCETGRFPLYDEIVWVKLGSYRWWPATILFPTEIPENIKKLKHSKGEFAVRFFGTHDHYWVDRGRVFLFQEGDRAHSTSAKTKVNVSFKKAVEEAAIAHQRKNTFALSMKAEIQTENKPPPYIRIKINKPVGNVKNFDPNISNPNPCECDLKHSNPCGPDSDCLNRLLLTECDPRICPAKDRCNNQRFEKRQYPPLEPYKTGDRGWGLKTLAPIRKGDFVIEYVGELVDEQEYQRRIHKMHEQKDENYYFLTIDKDRIIDAGPKGNLARFMNHSCQPNCATQKWTVSGDTRVGLFALTDIPAETEVTFNYQLQCIGKEKKVCGCGAPNCNGFIGGKTKLDESQKKPKSRGIKRKRGYSLPPPNKNDGPCFVCGHSGNVGTCQNKICSKSYHLECVSLRSWPEGKWVCPWHNCNVCTKRTIRCCVKCISSYCPVHSEGNVRYDNLLGFVCSEHDPNKESQEFMNSSISSLKASSSAINVHTEETDVTSTTVDESDQVDDKGIKKSISEPAKGDDVGFCIKNFAQTLEIYEAGLTADHFKQKEGTESSKRKRSASKLSLGKATKKIKLSQPVVKPTLTYNTPAVGISAQKEVKLLPEVPVRHLRASRKLSSESEIKQLINRQNEYEKDLPIRKRTKPRCEVNM